MHQQGKNIATLRACCYLQKSDSSLVPALGGGKKKNLSPGMLTAVIENRVSISLEYQTIQTSTSFLYSFLL